MSERNVSTREVDERVSAAYRDIAAERAPERLDTAVLRAAARQAAQAPGGRGPAAWYRPLTLLATAGFFAVVVMSVAHFGGLETGGDRLELDAPAAVVPPATGTGRLLPAEDHCSEAERSESGSWWRCIRELERRGLTRAAEAELAALLSAYPGFVEPE